MKIIIGLGNPGLKYEKTRHNAGFMAVDFYARLENITEWQKSFQASITKSGNTAIGSIIMKPDTFMNNSGAAVKAIVDFYKLDSKNDILVLHDDVDLPFGKIRFTHSSSHAGQNGVRSIIDTLGSQDFHRIRIGVESRALRTEIPTDAFVLQKFTSEQLQLLKIEIFPEVKACIDTFLKSETALL